MSNNELMRLDPKRKRYRSRKYVGVSEWKMQRTTDYGQRTNYAITKKAVPYILIAPVFIYYLVFWIQPVLSAVFGSFLDFNNTFTFQYYLKIIRDEYFYRAFFNTLFIVVFSVTIEFFVAFGLALLINTRFKGSGAFFLSR